MTTNVSKQERTVKRIPAKLNPRPPREDSVASFADVIAMSRREPNGPCEINPRPCREEPRSERTAPVCRDQCGGRKSKQAQPTADEAKKVRKKYPIGIQRLQGWLGVRGGVSPKLRRLCDSGDEALLLNQLVCYWFARGTGNRVRARVRKAHHRWVAKSHREWAEELGMTPKQVRRSIVALEKKGFIEVRTWRFNGANTTHVRPLVGRIATASGCPEDQKPYRRKVETETVVVNANTYENLVIKGQLPFRVR